MRVVQPCPGIGGFDANWRSLKQSLTAIARSNVIWTLVRLEEHPPDRDTLALPVCRRRCTDRDYDVEIHIAEIEGADVIIGFSDDGERIWLMNIWRSSEIGRAEAAEIVRQSVEIAYPEPA